MYDQAVAKIKNEMTAGKNNSYVQVVGAFLLQHIAAHPEAAGAIMTEGKTVAKSLDEMRKVAEKQKVGSCAVLTDQEGFAIVLKYFGVEGSAVVPATPSIAPPAQSQPTTPAAKSTTAFEVNLEDLLD